jgi:hypothetical protein
MDMLKDNDIVDIHTATEEQISKIGKSKGTTPMSMNYFTPFIAENLDEIVKEFKYRNG